jgi:hypothetical protein
VLRSLFTAVAIIAAGISGRFRCAVPEMVIIRLTVVAIFPISYLGGGCIRIENADLVLAMQPG